MIAGIVAKSAVAVQLDEVGEDELDELGRERPLHVSRDLHALPGREAVIDLVAQLDELLLERRDLFRDAHLLVARQPLELLDLALELDDRLLEVEGLAGGRHYLLPRCRCTESVPRSERRSFRAVLLTASVKLRERSRARNPLPSL